MIDGSQVLGLQTARAMEYLEENEEMDGGRLVACMVAVIVADKDDSTSYTRTFCSDRMYYEQVGLAFAALDCIKDGFRFKPPAEQESDDE